MHDFAFFFVINVSLLFSFIFFFKVDFFPLSCASRLSFNMSVCVLLLRFSYPHHFFLLSCPFFYTIPFSRSISCQSLQTLARLRTAFRALNPNSLHQECKCVWLCDPQRPGNICKKNPPPPPSLTYKHMRSPPVFSALAHPRWLLGFHCFTSWHGEPCAPVLGRALFPRPDH